MPKRLARQTHRAEGFRRSFIDAPGVGRGVDVQGDKPKPKRDRRMGARGQQPDGEQEARDEEGHGRSPSVCDQ